MKKAYFIVIISAVLFSCNEHKESKINHSNKVNDNFELIGKKGILTYPEFTANVTYLSDSTLHWKTIDKKGVVAEGDEKVIYRKLSDNLFFLNWIEKDGFTVSQIIDTKEGTVKAFLSFSDDQSKRGKRSSTFADAKFKFEE